MPSIAEEAGEEQEEYNVVESSSEFPTNGQVPAVARDDSDPIASQPQVAKSRFCHDAMTGKKVRVFWPVDESWYTGTVQKFDPATGEHLLQYPDGDTEWVKIGEHNSISNSSSSGSVGGGGGDNTGDKTGPSTTTPGSCGNGNGNGRGALGSGVGSPEAPVPALISSAPGLPPTPLPIPNPQSSSSSHLPPPLPPSSHYGDSYMVIPHHPANSIMDGSHDPSLTMNPYAGFPAHHSPHGYPTPTPTSSMQQPSSGGNSSMHHPHSGYHPQLHQHHHLSLPPPGMPPQHYRPSSMYPHPYGEGVQLQTLYNSLGGGRLGVMTGNSGGIGGSADHHLHHGLSNAPGDVEHNHKVTNSHDEFSSSNQNHISTPASTKIDNSKNDSSNSKRKSGPKAWTKEEDALLLSIVRSMQMPMKWSIVAQSLTDRTGKQCRERYVNHLNPRLKSTDWSTLEDHMIFHLYNSIGSHWAKMSKIIPGRTDNGIKNRFHNLRRQYEREDEHRLRLSTSNEFQDVIRLDRLRPLPKYLVGHSTQLWDMQTGIGILAAQSILDGSSSSSNSSTSSSGGGGGSSSMSIGNSLNRMKNRFGPFRKADYDLCVRCGLLAPSMQTGDEVCTKSGWCQACTRIPPHITTNLLRECLNLRREPTLNLRELVEAWADVDLPTTSSGQEQQDFQIKKEEGDGDDDDEDEKEQEDDKDVGQDVDKEQEEDAVSFNDDDSVF